MESPRVRFAPSPTGQVHIGNIRTAIFNWLFARHCNGSFLLRIEDTDRERSTPEAIAALFDVMEWLGLDYDEEPLYQSSRADAHIAAADALIEKRNAYRHAKGEGDEVVLFRIPLDAPSLPCVRKAGDQEIKLHPDEEITFGPAGVQYYVSSKKGKPVLQEACLAGFQELKVYDADDNCTFELAPNVDTIVGGETITAQGVRMSFTRYEVVFTDLVKGELSKPLDSMKYQVIVRSNGLPVFHLANVCDDAFQNVTHIVRGDDHVENTYRHVLLYTALGYDVPKYAHLPMITNAQGKPYSKRDGDAFVGDFRTKGFLSEALFNYLSLLGWSPGDDREKMTIGELVEAFTLDRVRSAPSQMDSRKLENLNGQYLAEMPKADFLVEAKRVADEQGWTVADDYLEKIVDLMQTRAKLFTDVASWEFLVNDDLDFSTLNKKARKKVTKPEVKAALEILKTDMASCDFSTEGLSATIEAVHEKAGFEPGRLNLAIRCATTGTNSGADLIETLKLLGTDSVTKRIHHALESLFENKED
jgi:glutamyl/glutaminyl-tRNA synthetase